MTDTTLDSSLMTALCDARERCTRQRLLRAPDAGLSVRLPGGASFLFIDAAASTPQRQSWRTPPDGAPAQLTLHATIYQLRQDVGAVLTGGGVFSSALANFGGRIPVAFDEQARHLGRMRAAASTAAAHNLYASLGSGANTALVANQPVCLGTTCQRLVLNAELFEKCAKAYVLAAATGQTVSTLPWWVRRIATGRLRKDQRRAQQRIGRGLLPEETRGY